MLTDQTAFEHLDAGGAAFESRERLLEYVRARGNWSRWGEEDQLGTLNLIDSAKRLAALATVRIGRSISLAREMPTRPGAGNPLPAQHFLRTSFQDDGTGIASDYYGILYHGYQTTHVDALSHIWDEQGLWGGRDPRQVLLSDGARWGGIEQWRDGIVTRAVLLDVPRFRGEPYVAEERPVTGGELEAVAQAQGVEVRSGDAALIYCGREAFERAHPEWRPQAEARPGLHASCLAFLRDLDVAVLGWDLLDASPNQYGLPWTVHAGLYAFGLAMIDNCSFDALSRACAAAGRYECALVVAPLPYRGGTGSPVNPLALL
jgi:kynurenine formamidase